MKGTVIFAAVNPAIPLAVVVFVTDPGFESAAPFWRPDVYRAAIVALVVTVEVPFAEVGGVEAVVVEDVGEGGHAGGHLVFVTGHALVWIAPQTLTAFFITTQNSERDFGFS